LSRDNALLSIFDRGRKANLEKKRKTPRHAARREHQQKPAKKPNSFAYFPQRLHQQNNANNTIKLKMKPLAKSLKTQRSGYGKP
jgi:hypothetical protein